MLYEVITCLCTELNGIEERHHPEFYLFLTTCTLAMMMLVSSVELLTIYVALELRITSYNVCYTKLLRSRVFACARLDLVLCQDVCADLRDHVGALDVSAITLRSAHELLLEDHDSGGTRITSYNVCYTKLLRAVRRPRWIRVSS